MAKFMVYTEIKEEEMNGTFGMVGREENDTECVDGKLQGKTIVLVQDRGCWWSLMRTITKPSVP
jgi:hypothetical protein